MGSANAGQGERTREIDVFHVDMRLCICQMIDCLCNLIKCSDAHKCICLWNFFQKLLVIPLRETSGDNDVFQLSLCF